VIHFWNLLKKYRIFVFIFFALALGLSYWLWQRSQRPVDAWSMMPKNAIMVIETHNFWNSYLRLSQAPLWQSLGETPEFAEINGRLEFLTTDLAPEKSWQAFFRDKSCLASLHLTGKQDFDFLYFVPLKSEEDKKLFEQVIAYLRKRTDYEILQRTYRGMAIQEIKHEASSQRLSFLQYGEYWIASYTPLLVEDVARKIQEGDFSVMSSQMNKVDKLRKVSFSQSNDWGIYINNKEFVNFIELTFKEDLKKYFKPLSYFAEGSFLTANPKSSFPLWEGVSFTKDKDSSSFLNIFERQRGKTLSIESYLPQRSALVMYLNFENTKQFEQAYATYWQKEGGDFYKNKQLFEQTYRLRWEDFYENAAGEMAFCMMESEDTKSTNKVIVWKTKSITLSQNWLDELAKNASAIDSTPLYSEKYDNYLIKRLPLKKFPEYFLGGLGQDFEDTYYLVVGECVVMSNRLQGLKKWINTHQYQQTWAQSASHRGLLQESYQYANLSVVLDVAQAWNILYQNASPVWQEAMNTFEKDLRQIDLINLQFRYQNEQFDTRLSLLAGTQSNDKGFSIEGYEVLMNHQFPRQIYTTPYIVKNHDTGANEILVQDFTNNIFLLNEQGRVLWQRPAGAPMRSNPLQIDIYQNGKLQYLYLTADRISLIDRLGRDVPKYPFFLPDTTQLNTLAYLDFGDKKHYYLASNIRGYLFMYDGERNRIAGWRPKQVNNRLGPPVQQIRLGNEDYLIACTENGTVYVFSREGQTRAGFPLDLRGSISNPLRIQKGLDAQNTLITALTDEGKIVVFDLLGGLQSETQLIRSSARSSFVACPDQNNQEWLIGIADNGLIQVLSAEGQLLFEQKFESTSAKWEIQYFNFDDNVKIVALTDKVGSKTYLYDLRGNAIGKPFPSNKKVHMDYDRNERKLIIYRTYGREVGKLALKVG